MSFKTLIEMFEYNVTKFGKKTLAHSRLISANGDIFDEKHSWNDIKDQSKRLACSLTKFGENTGKHIAIWADNSYRWMVADLAIMYLGAVSLNLAPSDTNLNIASALKNCDVNTIFIGNTKLLNKLITLIAEYHLPIRNIVLLDFRVNKVENNSRSISVYFWDQLMAQETSAGNLNTASYPIDTNFPASTVMNSGAKNSCKLIPLSHKNIISNIESLAKDLKYKKNDSVLSCHSLSDIFNKNIAYYSAIYAGASLFFPLDSLNFFYELAYKNVSIACINPKDLAELEENISLQLEKDGFLNFLLNIPIISYFAQSGLKKSHANNLKYFICSGAYLPAYLDNNMRHYGFKLRQSYGTTECAGPISITTPNQANNIGKVLSCFEWKMNNTGELEISSTAITHGYINSSEYEAESFYSTSSSRWFRTGDIVSKNGNGNLVYLGKACEQVLNSQEKSVSLSKAEKMLRNFEYIDDVLIVGEEKPFISALITIRDERFRKLFKKLDKYSIRQQCEKAIDQINKSLPENERVRKFAILDQSLRTNKSELSPNKKVRRKVIEARYQSTIDSFYE
ncbi:MAG: AMP-binding protein [Candidatus Caenarcaniphilales bacterium]|nr:AMP-binding protein [Candidatus Caenarcaniphilales bacterium]